MNDFETREKLNRAITSGKIVIIYDYDSLEIMQLLSERLVSKNVSHVEIWQSIDEKSDSELSIYVSKDVVEKAVNMYHMYDFSDKVFVISDSDQYGSLFNYVKTGILTAQEMVDALLYKI